VPDVLDGACPNGIGELGTPERVVILGLEGDVRGPSITSDASTLYFSATIDGVVAIYEAERADTRSAVFGSMAPLSELATAGRNGTPFISPDGQRLYFYSTRDNAADLDLWLAVREPQTGRFSPPAALSELNTRAYDLLPWVTPDELMIAFVSTRPTRAGSSDIWYAARTSRDSPFEAPAPAVELNSEGDEGRVALSADGLTVFFSSDRDGSPDLFAASRSDSGQPFGTPEAIEILNSASTDHDVALSADGRELFFVSTRDGSSAIWRALRSCS
jgi:Tol biopolymer transport system component